MFVDADALKGKGRSAGYIQPLLRHQFESHPSGAWGFTLSLDYRYNQQLIGWLGSVSMNYRDIITIESGKRSGKPCIRGMRITVYDVLDYLASGMSIEDVLRDFPYLTREDIQACLAYAADRERGQLVA